MKHFPIFLNVAAQRIVVSGGGEAALAKLRLLLKTEARIEVYAADPAGEILQWAEQGRLTLIRRAVQAGDAHGAALFYSANDDEREDGRAAGLARAEGTLVNAVDNLEDSQFITPAIVDRDPVTVAVGTEGAAPVLARAIKRGMEERLPQRLGMLARIGKAFRPIAERLPHGRARREFWTDYYFDNGPRAFESGGAAAVEAMLEKLLGRHLSRSGKAGHVDFVGAGPGDPELLTLKARTALDQADVVVHDRLIAPEILELARREAVMIEAGKTGFGQAMAQDDINGLIVQHAEAGAHVVRLKSGDPGIFGRLDDEIEAIEAAGLGYRIVPGITAASASAAAIGQSLTRRGRNSSVRLLTGHDMQGFAEHDWRALARRGQVAAVYMGKRTARFIQGRLTMHGADSATPVTFVENASRIDQRVFGTTLGKMARTLADADLTGPALTFIGLAPREAMAAAEPLKEEIA